MSIQIALIVAAPRELILTAGQQEIEPEPEELTEEEQLPFLNIGRARGDEVHMSGALIGDPEDVAAGLTIDWYLPDEEEADLAQPVDLSEVKVIITTTPRHKAEPGRRWHYRLDSRRPGREIKFYDGGFQPPFRASDITIYLEHLINYNYDGYIITRVDYLHKKPSYTEAEWSVPTLESEGVLED
ncbi:MAG: hypothetical protein LBV79_04805 [Candidatus Adiutrix sp.]|jgi:hypothetical protein|nr:hypothetical protein [Candidatus Adiutrix sp.]